MKKSFILHIDSLDILRDLTDEQAGKLFKAIADYNSGNEKELDQITKMVFLPFKNQFIRDGLKFDAMIERQREKGLKSAAAKKKKPKQQKSTTVNRGQLQPTETTYNDSVNDSNSDSVNEFEITFSSFLEMRKKIKKPATERAIELIHIELEKLAPANEKLKIDILNQSIKNCYQDVYPLKKGFGQPQIITGDYTPPMVR